MGQKIKISPWEVIEGHKNPAPISWSLFGAVRLEKKPLAHEEQHRLLMYHTHSLRQADSHYMQSPPLPPEELQPPPEKVVSCVSVYVCEREKVREGENMCVCYSNYLQPSPLLPEELQLVAEKVVSDMTVSVCVTLCVCMFEREGGRERMCLCVTPTTCSLLLSCLVPVGWALNTNN